VRAALPLISRSISAAIAASRKSGINAMTGDPREVVRDPEARYWGGRVEERSLVPLGEARLGRIGLNEWLRRSSAAA
jgi:hypothetical protein